MKLKVLVFCLVFIVFSSFYVLAAPSTIKISGVLFDNNKLPAKGTHKIELQIFDAQNKNIENAVFSALEVDEKGIFFLEYAPKNLDFNTKNYFVDFYVDGKKLDPRQPLTSVPYALNTGGAGGTLPDAVVKNPTSDQTIKNYGLIINGTNAIGSTALSVGNLWLDNKAKIGISAFGSETGIYAFGSDKYGINVESNTGIAGRFAINNVNATSSALVVENTGKGIGISVTNSGSKVGLFINQKGEGKTTTASDFPYDFDSSALRIKNEAKGFGLNLSNTNKDAKNPAFNIENDSLGSTSRFVTTNPNSTSPALVVENKGKGNGIEIKSTRGKAAKFVGDVEVLGTIKADNIKLNNKIIKKKYINYSYAEVIPSLHHIDLGSWSGGERNFIYKATSPVDSITTGAFLAFPYANRGDYGFLPVHLPDGAKINNIRVFVNTAGSTSSGNIMYASFFKKENNSPNNSIINSVFIGQTGSYAMNIGEKISNNTYSYFIELSWVSGSKTAPNNSVFTNALLEYEVEEADL